MYLYVYCGLNSLFYYYEFQKKLGPLKAIVLINDSIFVSVRKKMCLVILSFKCLKINTCRKIIINTPQTISNNSISINICIKCSL